jgi:hypothetical protein
MRCCEIEDWGPGECFGAWRTVSAHIIAQTARNFDFCCASLRASCRKLLPGMAVRFVVRSGVPVFGYRIGWFCNSGSREVA